MGVPSLVSMRVLSRLAGQPGRAGGGFGEGFGALLEAMLAQVCWGGAEAVLAARGGAAAGGGGAPVLRLVTREDFSMSATLVVRVATFSTRPGSLWNVAGGGVCLAPLLRCRI